MNSGETYRTSFRNRYLRVAAVSLGISLATLAGACFANGDITGRVTRIVVITPGGTPYPNVAGVATVNIAGTISTPAACNVLSSFAIDLGTNGGKAALSSLQTAQALGYNVRVTGKGTCTLWDDNREDLYTVDINYP